MKKKKLFLCDGKRPQKKKIFISEYSNVLRNGEKSLFKQSK